MKNPHPTRQIILPVTSPTILSITILICLTLTSCRENSAPHRESTQSPSPDNIAVLSDPCRPSLPEINEWPHPRTDEYLDARRRMTQHIRTVYRFNDQKVLTALENVPRHWFIPDSERPYAYSDSPLPIGSGQTISQPYIVAFMTAQLGLTPLKKVLEIGTGSGYQAAVLSELTPHVYTIEIVKDLADTAARRFRQHGYTTIKAKHGDGYLGWPEHAPFDAIIVTAAPEDVPQPLIHQLTPGGKICIPVGGVHQIQNLILLTKQKDGKMTSQSLMPVRFVPFTRDPASN